MFSQQDIGRFQEVTTSTMDLGNSTLRGFATVISLQIHIMTMNIEIIILIIMIILLVKSAFLVKKIIIATNTVLVIINCEVNN